MRIFRGCLIGVCLVPLAFGAAAFAYTDFGRGKPITFQDLAGKKICWDSGRWVLYQANGQFLNSRGVHGSWVIVDRGAVEWRNEVRPGKYRSARYGQWEILPDGRLHSYSHCLLCGDHDNDHWATPCN